MVMLSSVINVVQTAPGVLEVRVFESRSMAEGWFVMGTIFVVAALASFRRKKLFAILFCAIGVYVFWLGVSQWNESFEATLSAVNQTIIVRDTSDPAADADSYPLNSVRPAVIESRGGDDRLLYIATKDGKVIFGTLFTKQDSYYRAQQAINTFLAQHVSASQAAPAPGSNTPPGSTQ